ncbi:MAG: hypothetical protein ABH952_03810 [Candidatus Omnitrophota bacterium]
MKKIFMILICLLVGCNAAPNIGNVIISNKSNLLIAKGFLEVCKQKLDFNNLKQGESKNLSFNVGADSDYKIVVNFQNGRSIKNSFGYVTSGVVVNDEIIVSSDKIDYKVNQKVKR